jgi:hypothetical protein
MNYKPMTNLEFYGLWKNGTDASLDHWDNDDIWDEERAIEQAVLARIEQQGLVIVPKRVQPIIQSQQYNDEVYRDAP